MKRQLFAVFLFVVCLSAPAQAAKYGMAGCGLGALAFEDKPGKIQIVAGTLNNILVPQTSAITSGTSNCYEDPREMASIFVAINHEALRKDISRGSGETLVGLSQIYGCSDHGTFDRTLQNHFDTIFPEASVSAKETGVRIETVIQNDKNLAGSCKVFS